LTLRPVGPTEQPSVHVGACADKKLTDKKLSPCYLWTEGVSPDSLHGTLWSQDNVDTLQAQFGQLIRRRRLALGLGQEALADKASLHRTHVSLLERGKRMPSLQVVKKLAAALDTTMASLMEELERAEPGEDAPTTRRPSRRGGR
jgi:ribosome-binding protein aMBF1 (putative translation factor)